MSLQDRVGVLLPLLNAAFPARLVEVLDRFLAEAVGGEDVELLLADYDQHELRPLSSEAGEPMAMGRPQPIDDSPAGRAYLAQAPVTEPVGDGLHVHVPISMRDERIGVLSVRLPRPVSADTLTGLAGAAEVLGYIILAASRFTDLFEQARRVRPLSLEAEVQWGLQPARAFSCPEFSLAGQLVPAYDVGGDSYDWVVNRHMASVCAIDAMGHGLQASMIGALAVTAMRNARRGGADLNERFAAANTAMGRQYPTTSSMAVPFATAAAFEVDIARARAVAVSAGHPWPYRLRDGRISQVELVPQYPFGIFAGTTYATTDLHLRPGDRLVLVSDGVLDAAPEGGEPFGETRLEAALLTTRTLLPHEAVRSMVRALLDYRHGDLRDDATIVLFDWHGPAGQR